MMLAMIMLGVGGVAATWQLQAVLEYLAVVVLVLAFYAAARR